MRCRCLLQAVLFLMAGAASAQAQSAPVFLEPDHWSWDAVRRLSVAGVAPRASDPSAASVTVQHARAVFAHAAAVADSTGRRDLARLARGYQRRLSAEADSAGMLTGLELGAGWTVSRGEARGGEGFFEGQDWVGAQPLAASNHPAVTLTAQGYLQRWLSWQVRGGYLADRWVLPAVTAGVALGPFDAWGGRRRLHYGAGRGGAIVTGSGFNAPAAFAHRTLDTFEGIGVHVRDPFEFPSFLRVLGPARIEVVGGRISRNGRVKHPYVVFGRFTLSPFSDRITLGVNRGAVFGGEGNDVTAGKLLGMVIGLRYAEFEDQVISGVMRYRPPLGRVPLELYVELGADDTAGAVRDIPTYITGFDIAALPGLSALAIALEHARYSGSCCGNPPWYRNVFFRGSWSDDGRLFAHPLGGHGREWLAHARLDLPHSGLMVQGQAFDRRRGHENLFAPERAGRSVGASVSLEFRRGNNVLRAEGGYEDAASWSQHRLSIMASHSFR